MPLPAVTDTLDNVDASHHDLYAETEVGKFVLDIAGDITGHPAVAPLENAFRKEQDKRKRQGRELDALKEKQNAGDGADGGENDADGKPLAASTRRRLEATHRQDLDVVASQVERYRTALESTLVDAALTNALVEANIAAPFMRAAKAMHRANLTVIEQDGVFQVAAAGSAGGTDQTLTTEAYIAAWTNSEEGRAFIAAPRNGGGAAHGSGAAGSRLPNPWRDESFNRTEQARIARDDPPLAKALARAAGRPEPRV